MIRRKRTSAAVKFSFYAGSRHHVTVTVEQGYFEKLVVAKEVPVFVGPERSLLFSQDPTTVTYLEKT